MVLLSRNFLLHHSFSSTFTFFFSFHFHKHLVHFLHFLNSGFVFLQYLFFIFFRSRVLWSEMQRLFMRHVDFIDCVWVYKITNIWRIKFLESISHFLFWCKFQEIFETVPLIITLLDSFVSELFTFSLSGPGIFTLSHLLSKIAFLIIFATHRLRILSWINACCFRCISILFQNMPSNLWSCL